MGYSLSTKTNTGNWIRYDYDRSADYRLFLRGQRIGTLSRPIRYSIRSEKALPRVQGSHLLMELGPELVSDAFREVLQTVAADDVEFFPVELRMTEQVIGGFHAVNILNRQPCFDLSQCEYTQTNFDPLHPTYTFTYYQVAEDVPSGCALTRVDEFPRCLVVSEKLKEACAQAKLKGLAFRRAVDLTGKGRDIVTYL